MSAFAAGECLVQLGVAQVLVDRLPADSVVTGKDGFRNTAAGALDELVRPFRREGLLPPFVGAALLGVAEESQGFTGRARQVGVCPS